MLRTCRTASPTPSVSAARAVAGTTSRALASAALKNRCMGAPTHRNPRSCGYPVRILSRPGSVQVRRDEVAEVLAADRLEGAAVVGVGRRGVGGGVGADP